jgi:hypothetical protein
MPTERGIREWQRKQSRMAAGLCRDCGKPRGKRGTGQRCHGCNKGWNDYQQKRKGKVPCESAT